MLAKVEYPDMKARGTVFNALPYLKSDIDNVIFNSEITSMDVD
jgi:hypothetical protein